MLMADVLDNLIWLSMFVFGFAAYMPDVQGVSYAIFVVPGYFIMAGFYQLGMEATYRLHAKLVHNPWWISLIATPLGVRNILYNELLSVMFRGMIPVIVVYFLAFFVGLIENSLWFLLTLPLLFCLYAVYSSISMAVTMFVKNDVNFIYFWVLGFSPVFLVSGAFYEKNRLPEFLRVLTELHPLSYVTQEIQSVMVFGNFNTMAYMLNCVIMVLITVYVMYLNERQFKKRFLT